MLVVQKQDTGLGHSRDDGLLHALTDEKLHCTASLVKPSSCPVNPSASTCIHSSIFASTHAVHKSPVLGSQKRCSAGAFDCITDRTHPAWPRVSTSPTLSARLKKNRLLMGSPLCDTAFSTSFASTPPSTAFTGGSSELPRTYCSSA